MAASYAEALEELRSIRARLEGGEVRPDDVGALMARAREVHAAGRAVLRSVTIEIERGQ